MSIGEAGQLTTNSPTANEPITVTLSEPLTDPIVVLSGTTNGGHPYTLRVVDEELDAEGNTTSFSFIIEEWEYLDGAHPVDETISWIAVEEGLHTLPDGRVIEAGQALGNHETSNTTFDGDFNAPPVVLTSVMTNNGGHTVDSDAYDISEDGFNFSLQEEEGGDTYHTLETVGWIAIQPGGDSTSGTAYLHHNVTDTTQTIGLGDTFDNAVVIAGSQTLNDTDPATIGVDGITGDEVDIFMREETSADGETTHDNETVGIVTFETGVIPCFTGQTGIATLDGTIAAEDLTPGTRVLTSDGGAAPVRLVLSRNLTKTELDAQPKLRPVVIPAGALGEGLPKSDLRLSPQHRILVSSPIARRMFGTPEVLIAAIKLVALPGVYVDTDIDAVTYVHLVFDEHQIVFAEGAPTESLLSGPQMLTNLPNAAREELLLLFPEIGQNDFQAEPARIIPTNRNQKRLVQRLAKNQRAPLERRPMQQRQIYLSA